MARTIRLGPVDLAALLVILSFGLLQLLSADLTVQGVDQVRDFEIARDIAHGDSLPLVGPVFRGRFHSGPVFYYLMALPLLVWDDLNAVLSSFALLQMAVVGFFWWQLRRLLDPLTAALSVALYAPLHLLVYAHSAWNPALIYPFSALLLVSFLHLLRGQTRAWLGVGLCLSVLLQLHPSTAPMVLGIALMGIWHWRTRLDRWFGAGLALALLLFVPYLLFQAQHGWPDLGAAVAGEVAGHSLWQNLSDLAKWRDLGSVFYRFGAALDSGNGWMRFASGAWLALLATGLGLALLQGRLWRGPYLVWLLGVVGLWLLVCMAYLTAGLVYYLDVLIPWLVLLAAMGWAGLLRSWSAGYAMAWLVLGVFLLRGLPSVWFYQALRDRGVVDVDLNVFTFPRLSEGSDWPLISERLVRAYYDFLLAHQINPDQVTGAAALLFREFDNRWHYRRVREIPRTDTAYYLYSPWLGGPVPAVDKGREVFRQAGHRLFRLSAPPVQITGGAGGNRYLPRTAGLKTHFSPPAPLPPRLTLEVVPGPVSVALRCSPPAPEGTWRDGSGQTRIPQVLMDRSIFYQAFRSLRLPGEGDPAQVWVWTHSGRADCDVSAASF